MATFLLASLPAQAGSAAGGGFRLSFEAAGSAESRTARYFEEIRDQPLLLAAFLRRMPKGGDLHSHLSGAVYAESYVIYAARDGLCVDRMTFALSQPPCDPGAGRPPAAEALRDAALYNRIIDAWSMRNFRPWQGSSHDHFFGAFAKFGPATAGHRGDMLAEVVARAAVQQELYVELLLTLDAGEAGRLGTRLGWEDDLVQLRDRLLTAGMAEIVADARERLDSAETAMRERLRCGTAEADAGCQVTVRYLHQATRTRTPEQVFAELVVGFELALADERVVGINLVGPEDSYIPKRDYELQMTMLDVLHRLSPTVNISLHAGELAPQLVPPEELRSHVRDAVLRGHARRIGHGVSVMYEDDPFGLLAEMSRHGVLVEICLTSNDAILGIQGPRHPFPIYLSHGVPVALATDDEGVLRTDLSSEFQRAVESYGLEYEDLKRLARSSLEHSFLPGASLWWSTERFTPVAVCSGDRPEVDDPSTACDDLLDRSERARLQWRLERMFDAFERAF